MLGISISGLNDHNVRGAIIEKLKTGCKVKILILDRNSKFVKARANEEIRGTGRWKTWRDWIKELIEYDDLHQR
jgi:hypothetical protein